MKSISPFIFIICIFVVSCSEKQEDKTIIHEPVKKISKFEQFNSKTGTTIKFIDYKLPNLVLKYGSADSRIRKLITQNETKSFYQISSERSYGTRTASIAYEDLLDVLKALKALKNESSNDLSSNPDYLENKFVTVDGFELGYYVNRNEIQWYIVLEKYGSDNTIFFSNVSIVEEAFNNARIKIESFKN